MSMDIGGDLTDRGFHCQNLSSVEQKHAHQWFVDVSEPELLSNKKKQAISGTAHVNISHWDNGSGYEQFSNHSSGSEHTRIFSVAGKNILSLDDGNLNKRKRKHFKDDSLVNLTMSQVPNYWNAGASGIREGLIHEAESGFPTSLGQSYNREERNTNTMNLTCQRSENGNFMLMPYHYNLANRGLLSMGQTFDKFDGNFLSPFETKNGSFMSIASGYNNVHESFSVTGAFHRKERERFTPMRTLYDVGASYFASSGQTHQKLDSSVALRGIANIKEHNLQQLVQGSEENGEVAATHGGTNRSVGLIRSHDLLSSPSSAEDSEVLNEKSNTENAIAAQTNTVTVDSVPKQKAPKKNSPNNFPANVKSLLSTGIFDGVPVKYVSWSREKTLRGIIKGTGYLCGCDGCKMNMNLNAYEFEQHAGCKTKHPNNHIYFVNGKTIYSVVQDLKGIQQEMIFEAIRNVTGSPINLKNFLAWKASYEAATRELQKIYGKDEAAKEVS